MGSDVCSDLLERGGTEDKFPNGMREYDEFDWPVSNGMDCLAKPFPVPV